MITISFCNQKGGVAKTTSATETAAILASRGKRVLAVDMDPQGNLSDVFGADLEGRDSVYELLRGDAALEDVIMPLAGIDVIPAEITLAMLEPELAGVALGRERRLRRALGACADAYDFCIIDCPPSLGLLVTMALTASDLVVIPTASTKFAAKGIMQLSDTIGMVREYANPGLRIAGVLFCMYSARQCNDRMMLEAAQMIAASLGTRVFSSRIRRAVEMEDAHNECTTLGERNPSAKPSEDYAAFVSELTGEAAM